MPIGLIAGNGTFPFLVLRAARQLGHDVSVVAIKGEAAIALDELAGELSAGEQPHEAGEDERERDVEDHPERRLPGGGDVRALEDDEQVGDQDQHQDHQSDRLEDGVELQLAQRYQRLIGQQAREHLAHEERVAAGRLVDGAYAGDPAHRQGRSAHLGQVQDRRRPYRSSCHRNDSYPRLTTLTGDVAMPAPDPGSGRPLGTDRGGREPCGRGRDLPRGGSRVLRFLLPAPRQGPYPARAVGTAHLGVR